MGHSPLDRLADPGDAAGVADRDDQGIVGGEAQLALAVVPAQLDGGNHLGGDARQGLEGVPNRHGRGVGIAAAGQDDALDGKNLRRGQGLPALRLKAAVLLPQKLREAPDLPAHGVARLFHNILLSLQNIDSPVRAAGAGGQKFMRVD